jgi:acetoin:2,6-dichlorophenolindophenol oxidoreductase subunit alpha
VSDPNQFLYSQLYRIRAFEEMVLENFPKGVFFGTTHAYIGQEADAVGVLNNLEERDIVFSNHRCHGHFLAYGGDPHALFAELMGKATGVCSGRGGSQHLQWGNFYSNGIQGGIVPVATGMALAEKMKSSGAIVFVFMGDGTLGEGVVYESLNMASLWKLPVLYVLENNGIAQTTPVHLALAGGMKARFQSFGIHTEEIHSSDVLEILAACRPLVEQIRRNPAPSALVLHTHRFTAHSKGDDTRNAEEIARMRAEHDPVCIQAERIDREERLLIEAKIIEDLDHAFQLAMHDPFPG